MCNPANGQVCDRCRMPCTDIPTDQNYGLRPCDDWCGIANDQSARALAVHLNCGRFRGGQPEASSMTAAVRRPEPVVVPDPYGDPYGEYPYSTFRHWPDPPESPAAEASTGPQMFPSGDLPTNLHSTASLNSQATSRNQNPAPIAQSSSTTSYANPSVAQQVFNPYHHTLPVQNVRTESMSMASYANPNTAQQVYDPDLLLRSSNPPPVPNVPADPATLPAVGPIDRNVRLPAQRPPEQAPHQLELPLPRQQPSPNAPVAKQERRQPHLLVQELAQLNLIEPELWHKWRAVGSNATPQGWDAKYQKARQQDPAWPLPLPYEPFGYFIQRQEFFQRRDYARMERQFWWREDHDISLRYPEHNRVHKKKLERLRQRRAENAQKIRDELMFNPATHRGYREGRGGQGGFGGGGDRGGPGGAAGGFAPVHG